jgi:Fic family protein
VAAVDDCSAGAGSEPVIASTVFAFGFVYTHPFVDGNGRLHRLLIHPVHARGSFNPPGVILPTSAANLRRLELYRLLLESYSPPLLKDIDWVFKMDGNVEIRNATADPYHFFDATAQAEFLF